jgi:hypothetical protein
MMNGCYYLCWWNVTSLMLTMHDEPLVQVVMDIKDLFSSIETNVNTLKQLVARELDCFC